MKKDTLEAFGKEIYLLGKDFEGVNYWLEEPKWDCGWYWGFGYVETYTNNKHPENARDIKSHQHFDGLFFKTRKNGFDAFREFFAGSVLSEKELWEFLELMKTAYTLKEAAEIYGRGGSNYGKNLCADIIKNAETAKNINTVLLPSIFSEVKKLLEA